MAKASQTKAYSLLVNTAQCMSISFVVWTLVATDPNASETARGEMRHASPRVGDPDPCFLSVARPRLSCLIDLSIRVGTQTVPGQAIPGPVYPSRTTWIQSRSRNAVHDRSSPNGLTQAPASARHHNDGKAVAVSFHRVDSALPTGTTGLGERRETFPWVALVPPHMRVAGLGPFSGLPGVCGSSRWPNRGNQVRLFRIG